MDRVIGRGENNTLIAEREFSYWSEICVSRVILISHSVGDMKNLAWDEKKGSFYTQKNILLFGKGYLLHIGSLRRAVVVA